LIFITLETGEVDLRTGAVGTTGARLTTRERALLSFLAERPLQEVARDELLVAVWGYAATSTSRAVDDTMRRLRRKIERQPRAPRHLITVHGVGYRFVPLQRAPEPVSRDDAHPLLNLPVGRADLDRQRVYHEGGAVVPNTRVGVVTVGVVVGIAQGCRAVGRRHRRSRVAEPVSVRVGVPGAGLAR